MSYSLFEIKRIRKKFSTLIHTEYVFRDTVSDQVANGVLFNQDLAQQVVEKLDIERAELAAKVEPHFPKKPVPKSRQNTFPARQFKKDGTPSSTCYKYLSKFNITPYEKDDQWYCSYKGEELPLPLLQPLPEIEATTISDVDFIKKYLMEQGWKPTLWNYKKDSDGKFLKEGDKLVPTTPKLRDRFGNLCPNLSRVQSPIAKDIVLYLTLSHRRHSILSKSGDKGWLRYNRVQQGDGRIPSDCDTIGASTRRVTHRLVCNVPRVGSLYGKELRSLFCVPREDSYMVGYDASGLEARVEAHETYRFDGGRYAKIVMEGDVHQVNADAWGCERSTAKGGKYALVYGCGVAKLAETLGCSLEQAKNYYEIFWDSNPALDNLKKSLNKQWVKTGRKFIRAIDNGPLWIRSPHAIVNTRFQSTGAICMKTANTFMRRDTLSYQGEVKKLIHYHDEEQWEVPKSMVKWKSCKDEEVAKKYAIANNWSVPEKINDKWFIGYCVIGDLGINSIRKAGKFYKMNVELDAEYKIGYSWADTH